MGTTLQKLSITRKPLLLMGRFLQKKKKKGWAPRSTLLLVEGEVLPKLTFYYTHVCVLPTHTRSSRVGLGANVGLYGLGLSHLILNSSLFNVC